MNQDSGIANGPDEGKPPMVPAVASPPPAAREAEERMAQLAGRMHDLEQAVERLMAACADYLLTAAATWRTWREGGTAAAGREAEELLDASRLRLLQCREELEVLAISRALGIEADPAVMQVRHRNPDVLRLAGVLHRAERILKLCEDLLLQYPYPATEDSYNAIKFSGGGYTRPPISYPCRSPDAQILQLRIAIETLRLEHVEHDRIARNPPRPPEPAVLECSGEPEDSGGVFVCDDGEPLYPTFD